MRPELLGQEVGFFVVVGLLILAAVVILQSPLPRPLRVLLVVALLLRIVGAVARFLVLVEYYGGMGDAVGYFREGIEMAPYFQSLDFSPITDPQFWFNQRWWGTTSMYWFSGAVIAVLGTTMLGEFLVFSLLSFLGLGCFVVAFKRSFPSVPITKYARWVWLFPSLWFWPSSVGKEAVVLFGLGMATMGFVGRKGRIHWIPLAIGVGLVFLIRPQFAALFLAVAILSYWLGLGGKWTGGRTMQGIFIAAASIAVILVGLRTSGMASFDLEGVQEYVEAEPGRDIGGGSGITAPTVGPVGLGWAFVNVLARPFPWEAGSIAMMASSLELMGLWILVAFRFRRMKRVLAGWRSSRLLRLAAAFIFAYSVSLGMMAANLGILARQRIFVFPFIFVFFEAVAPAAQRVSRRFHPAMPRVDPRYGTGPGGAAWPVPTQGVPERSSSP